MSQSGNCCRCGYNGTGCRHTQWGGGYCRLYMNQRSGQVCRSFRSQPTCSLVSQGRNNAGEKSGKNEKVDDFPSWYLVAIISGALLPHSVHTLGRLLSPCFHQNAIADNVKPYNTKVQEVGHIPDILFTLTVTY